MNFNIVILAGAVAAVVLGVAFTRQPESASVSREPRVAEQPSAPSQHRLELGPSAETNDKVYDYQ